MSPANLTNAEAIDAIRMMKAMMAAMSSLEDGSAYNNTNNNKNVVEQFIHTWHGSVRPRVDDLIAVGNSTVQIATELVYRTIPSYGSMALVFVTGWVVAISLSICVSCWLCSRNCRGRKANAMGRGTTRREAVFEQQLQNQQVERAVPVLDQGDFVMENDDDLGSSMAPPSAPPLVLPPRYLFDPSGTRRSSTSLVGVVLPLQQQQQMNEGGDRNNGNSSSSSIRNIYPRARV